MKRLLSFFLALCLAFSLAAPVGAASPEEVFSDDLLGDDLFVDDRTSDDFSEDDLSDDGSGGGLSGNADPASLDDGFAYTLAPNAAGGYTITFSGTGTLTRQTVQAALQAEPSVPINAINEVIVEPGITAIGSAAFLLNGSITSVTLPEGLTSIESMAFYSCDGLLSIRFPASVRTIGEKAFAGCTRLLSAALPEELTSIGAGAFSNCIRLADVSLPAGLTVIGEDAFWNCACLTAVTLPAGLTALGADAFANCDAIETLRADIGTLDNADEHALRALLAASGLTQASTVRIEWIGAYRSDDADAANASRSPDELAALGLLAGGVLFALPIVSAAFFSAPDTAAPAMQRVLSACTGAVNAVRDATRSLTGAPGLNRSAAAAHAG